MFLRLLTRGDDPQSLRQSEIATELIRQIEVGDVTATTSDAVLAEVAFMLTTQKHYGLAVDTAVDMMSTLVRLYGFRHHDKRTLLRALDLWAMYPRIGFVDALTAASAQRRGIQLATFDRHFDVFPDIERWQPAESGAL